MRRALAALALLLSACRGPAAQAGLRPNVVLVVVDTLRFDHLGCYGYGRPTSPHVDALAARGLRFERAYAQAPWTTPSVAALLTSRFPSELGIRLAPHRLDGRFVTLAETLREAGYRTAAVMSHDFLGAEWGFQQGFERFDESNVRGHAGISSPGVTRRALELARLLRHEPFFLFVHYFDPHFDYLEHARFRFAGADRYDGPIASGLPYTDLIAKLGELGPADRQRLVDLYDSEVAFTDDHIGGLLRGLRRMGLEEDSLIVVTADHGEEFLDHGGLGHGGTLFNEVVQVPLVVKLPRSQARKVVATPVALIDVLPTVLDVVGLPRSGAARGRSLLAVGAREMAPPLVWSETDWADLRAGIGGRFKLILDPRGERDAMYDVLEDPAESDNLIRRLYRPKVAASFREMRAAVEAWRAALPETAAASTVAPDEEAARRLRALGYLR